MPGELVVDKPIEQPAQEEKNQEKTEDSKEGSVASQPSDDAPASRAVVGIIYPPPEVRSIQLVVEGSMVVVGMTV